MIFSIGDNTELTLLFQPIKRTNPSEKNYLFGRKKPIESAVPVPNTAPAATSVG